MWYGKTIYFLSDHDAHQRENIWAYDTVSHAFRQITHYTDFDIDFPSLGTSLPPGDSLAGRSVAGGEAVAGGHGDGHEGVRRWWAELDRERARRCVLVGDTIEIGARGLPAGGQQRA